MVLNFLRVMGRRHFLLKGGGGGISLSFGIETFNLIKRFKGRKTWRVGVDRIIFYLFLLDYGHLSNDVAPLMGSRSGMNMYYNKVELVSLELSSTLCKFEKDQQT